ncbi:MarR family winged helix-turn-helix transcriptional regulator [Erythrobacter colymbi]|jgi:DNA-binding MarR family transcriptional regulator|uniref:MarR family winged helix-turn-helix transcriptional regulator n=1 Tax=Erythrobacter colymbi TaxID=1161202 RepID=UPI000A37A195|nr:MarR family transcriptional regulator [Erythrobacter colymbi]
MMMQSDQTAAGPAAKFLTETDQLVFLMEEVTRRLRRIFDTSVEQFGLTRTQWRTLAYLYRTPGMTQTELARELELERASVGQAIDRLEELSLVERRSALNDRRVWQIHLMPAAVELLPKLRAEADAVYTRLLAETDKLELEQLRGTLTRMQANLDRI